MKVGLLLCDHVAEKFQGIAGDYPEMFGNWLKGWDLEILDCVNGEFPASPDVCDAYVATGSRHSAYDKLEWIDQLKAFLVQLKEEAIPYIGICFGHQIMAEAFGGKVEKAPSGWGVGILPLRLLEAPAWMAPSANEISLHYMHQDQVNVPPPGARILASSDHCPVAAMSLGTTMIGIQAHPEFGAEYSEALLRDRISRIGEDRVYAALASLTRRNDGDKVRSWCENLLGELSREAKSGQ